MDALVTPVWEVLKAVGEYTATHLSYLFNLKHNLNSLKDKMEQLKHVSEDVKTNVEYEERVDHVKRTYQLENWLRRVQGMEEKVNETLEKEEKQEPCFGVSWFPKNCCTSYKLGKKASQLLNEVKELKDERSRLPLTSKEHPTFADARLMEDTVGMDSMLEKVLGYVEDDNVGIIGLYGMAGVGKTTLLKKINNACISLIHPATTRKRFDLVIWAAVPNTKGDTGIDKVQDVIRNKFPDLDNIWKDRNRHEKAVEISKLLRKRKFLLLLDDLWERFDLLEAGIPVPDNGSKVIFTTRSENVCGQMQAHKKIKMECLSQEDALELFRMNVGEETYNYHPRIPECAEDIVQKCQGLPLALVTAGRAMASRKNHRNWEHAVTTLKRSLPKLPGMVKDVFPVLKLSYDYLQDDTFKSCFLYRSIFPAHYSMKADELIDLWIGEGIIIHESSDTCEARNHGHNVIESLKLASLFQVDELDMFVTMHDVIHEMALWIACDDGKTKKILMRQGEGAVWSNKSPGSAEWGAVVERVSLWGQNIEDVAKLTSCHNLLSFIAREITHHGTPCRFPSNFFPPMRCLKVLDLSYNKYLEFLEGIGELISLCYLNLSGTAIRELPAELKKLKKLRVFVLNDMKNLKQIAPEVMSALSSLQLFSELKSPFLDSYFYEDMCKYEMRLLSVLEKLEHVSEISLTLCNESSVHLLGSSKLKGCTRALSLISCSDMTSIKGSSSSLQNLESLSIHYCKLLEQGLVLEYNVEKNCFRNYGYFHNLSDLCIDHCPNLIEVVGEDLGAEGLVFSSLKIIRLYNLPKLETIYPRALPSPCLMKIDVYECPSLKQLPLNSSSAMSSLKEITGEQSWWDGLWWEDEEIKFAFDSKFHPSVELMN